MAFTPGESVVQYASGDGVWVPALVEGSDGGSPEVISIFVLPIGLSPGYHLDGIEYDEDGVSGTYKTSITTPVAGDLEVAGGIVADNDIEGANLIANGDLSVSGAAEVMGDISVATIGAGLLLMSPDGTVFRVIVSDLGALSTEEVP